MATGGRREEVRVKASDGYLGREWVNLKVEEVLVFATWWDSI